MKTAQLLYGKTGLQLLVPTAAVILDGQDVPPLPGVDSAVRESLEGPIGLDSLSSLISARRPQSVAITISDITRPVPNQVFLPPLLDHLRACGIRDDKILIIVGTGMHRPSTPEEQEILVGREILEQVELIDHRADDRQSLVRLSDDPPVYICRRFAEADFKIVTGFIEPHFMAGFSGGRKGVCPALVDLRSIQRFHGYKTLSSPKAENGVLQGNPLHEIALTVARDAGVDFLFNVALTRDHEIAGIYCGELEQAHLAGCRQVAAWNTAEFEQPFDLVITNGGGFPLDLTFYQTVKGMCTALPALHEKSVLLQVSSCDENLGSPAYSDLLLRYGSDWRRFLADAEARKEHTELDQWELQMQARVLARIGRERLRLVSDGIPAQVQEKICVTPVLGPGTVQERTQRAVDEFLQKNPGARVAVIPHGPYTMLKQKEGLDA